MKNPIDHKEIKKLIDLMEERDLSHFELEVEGFKVTFSKNQINPTAVNCLQSIPAPSQPDEHTAGSQESPSDESEAEENNLHYIVSPMVGTFYRAANPSSPPFIEVGETVKKNQTLCIIEAMKLMNEIESDIDGVVEKIFIENGKPIDYGQRLISIKSL
jgi:acetyl-CoA carboxylase biotin carboxyl carrier protein